MKRQRMKLSDPVPPCVMCGTTGGKANYRLATHDPRPSRTNGLCNACYDRVRNQRRRYLRRVGVEPKPRTPELDFRSVDVRLGVDQRRSEVKAQSLAEYRTKTYQGKKSGYRHVHTVAWDELSNAEASALIRAAIRTGHTKCLWNEHVARRPTAGKEKVA
jgi:hypothetical protein